MTSGKFRLNRREFAKGGAAVILGSSELVARLSALESGPAVMGEFAVDFSASRTPFNRMLFGQFLEHFQRQVYGGVFEPGSPLADEKGFRTDVISALARIESASCEVAGRLLCVCLSLARRSGQGPPAEPRQGLGRRRPEHFRHR